MSEDRLNFGSLERADLSLERQRGNELASRLAGYLRPNFLIGRLFGACDGEDTKTSRVWSAWELTGDYRGNLGLAVSLPDILSFCLNNLFRLTAEEGAEDAKRSRQNLEYYYGIASPLVTPQPKNPEKFARVLGAAHANLVELFSCYVLIGDILVAGEGEEVGWGQPEAAETEELAAYQRVVPIVKFSKPPDEPITNYWQSALIAIEHGQRMFLHSRGFEVGYSLVDRIVTELQGVVNFQPPPQP